MPSHAQAEAPAPASAEFAAAIPVCSESLRTGENPPLAAGWKSASHMSGTPYGMARMRERDMEGMLEAMAFTRETFVLAEQNLTLTQYYKSGEYIACGISGTVAVADQPAVAGSLASGLETKSRTGRRVAELQRQYELTANSPAYRLDSHTVLIEQGSGETIDLFSIIVIKD